MLTDREALLRQRRRSSILKKCEDLMQALWEDGYRLQMPWTVLRDYVTRICGGFRTTVADYTGRLAIPYRSRGREGCIKYPAKKGYLERFGFIERAKNPRMVFLLHERVNRDYHFKQTNVTDFSLSLSARENENRETTERQTTTTTTQREREIKPVTNFSHFLTQQEETILGAARENFNPNLFGARPLKPKGEG